MTTKNPKTLLSPRLQKYFKDYSSYHKTKGNQLTHYVGITLIVVSLLGLLGGLPIAGDGLTGHPYFRVDGGTLLLTAGVLWYLILDWKLAVPFSMLMTGFYFLGRVLPDSINWAFFITGWILQGIGHAVFEKKSPAFFKNVVHLLIGPLWIFSKLIGYK